jgi:hypothetical protein
LSHVQALGRCDVAVAVGDLRYDKELVGRADVVVLAERADATLSGSEPIEIDCVVQLPSRVVGGSIDVTLFGTRVGAPGRPMTLSAARHPVGEANRIRLVVAAYTLQAGALYRLTIRLDHEANAHRAHTVVDLGVFSLT